MATNKKTAGANKPADKEKLTKAPEVEEVVKPEAEPAAEPIEEQTEALDPEQLEDKPGDDSGDDGKNPEPEAEPATEMVVEKPKAPDFAKTAAGLINKLRLSQVWRCQKTGYWFTREDYAQAHAKSADSKLEIYKK